MSHDAEKNKVSCKLVDVTSPDYNCPTVSLSGMGSHHQTRHAVSEEDQSSAAAVGRLPARDARQEEEGERRAMMPV